MTAHRRMIVLLLSFIIVVLIPRDGWVKTEVRHGESPQFSRPIAGRYAVTVVGHYTDQEGLATAGVRTVEWQSDKPAKRRAEMLALRTAFLEWFVEEWVRQGGKRAMKPCSRFNSTRFVEADSTVSFVYIFRDLHLASAAFFAISRRLPADTAFMRVRSSSPTC